MRKFILPGLALALPVAALLGPGDAAAAQKAKRLTYEQAFAKCRDEVRAAMPGETTQSAPRYTYGAGCMKRYGYRLKKGAL